MEVSFGELANKAVRKFEAPFDAATRGNLLEALRAGDLVLLNGVLTLQKQHDTDFADKANPSGAYIQAHYIDGERTSASDTMEEQDLNDAIAWGERIALQEPHND